MKLLCILMLAFNFVNANKRYSREDDITAALTGSELTLTCNRYSYNSVYWEWKSSSDNAFKPIRKDQERGALFQNRQKESIIIKNLTKSGNGGYRCRYYDEKDGSNEKNRNMSNDYWIEIAAKGRPIQLTCKTRFDATGYLWRKVEGNRELPVISYDENLTVGALTSDIIETYRCGYYSRGWFYNQIMMIIEGEPRIKIMNPYYKVLSGENVTLKCQLHNTFPPIHNSFWIKPGASISDTTKFQQKIENTTNGQMIKLLQISKVDVNDNGFYNCVAHNTFGKTSVAVQLNVGNKPKNPHIETAFYTVKEGGNVSLQCSPRGEDITVLWWEFTRYHYSRNITRGSSKYSGGYLGNSNLIISQFSTNDVGKYICYVANDFGFSSSLDIFTKLGVGPEIKETKKDYYVELGSSVTMTCSAVNTTRTWWSRFSSGASINSSKQLFNSTVLYSFKIERVKNIDKGEYTCHAENMYGETNRKLNLIAGLRPSITANTSIATEEYSDVKLFVQISENTQQTFCSVSWFVNGLHVSLTPTFHYQERCSHPTLTIYKPLATNSGVYKCVVTNEFGYESINITLSVWKIPVVNIDRKSPLHVAKGNSTTLNCDVLESSPDPNEIYWLRGRFNQVQRNRLPIASTKYSIDTNTKRSILTIRNAEIQETDNYTCVARHSYANGSKSIELLIGSPPVVSCRSVLVVKHNEKVRLNCKVQNTVNAWWKYRTNIKRNCVNERVQLQYSGNYTCYAKNNYGFASDTVSIVVLYASARQEAYDKSASETFKIYCHIKGGHEIKWSLNGHIVNSTAKRNDGLYFYKIVNASRYSAGNYSCGTSFGSDSVFSNNITVKIRDIPLVNSTDVPNLATQEGFFVKLSCSYTSYPEATDVFWTKDGIPLSSKTRQSKYNGSSLTDPSLSIHRALRSDTGVYICNVNNKRGIGSSSSIFLHVYVPDKLTDETSAVFGATTSCVLAVCIILIALFLWKRRKSSGNKSPVSADAVGSSVTEHTSSDAISRQSFLGTNGHNDNSYCQFELDSKTNIAESTYHNVLEVRPTRIHIDELKEYITKREVDNGLHKEYKSVPHGAVHPTIFALKKENIPRNRYKTTHPYDHSRVVLNTRNSKSDYINANFIDGVEREKQYIACQGPIKSTLTDHLRMIWQEDVRQIIMLTNLVEGMKIKCERYWPDCTGEMSIGPFSLTTITEKERATYVTREIDIHYTKTSQSRRLIQYHFTAWPDHGTPNPLDLVAFYRHVVAEEVKKEVPILVHCSAGIGRTGTYIGLDALTKEGKATGYIDIFSYLKQMRYCRMNMIQTEDQYVFLHHALLEIFKVKDTLIKKEQFGDVWRSIDAERGPINSQDLYIEFKVLKSIVDDDCGETAVLEPNDVDKNRNKNIVPLESSRVFLISFEKGRSNYINAVNVPSYTKERGFIVTQLPLPDTTVDFWTMMVDHGSSIIVLILENEKDANMIYAANSSRHEKGSFVIDVVDKENCGNGIIKTSLDVSRKNYEEQHTIYIYQIVSKSTIQPRQLCELVDLVSSQRSGTDRPVTVVSSDGAKNCGLFCTFVNAVTSIIMDDSADIFHIARVVKLQQPQLLSNYDEYKMCYEALHVYLESTNIYANT